MIINAGKKDNIEVGDEFQILDTKGSEVVDPDTNETIGYLDLIKATVKVTELHDRMCICSSRYLVSDNSILSGISLSAKTSLMGSLGAVTEQEKLNVDLTQVTGGKRKSNEKIRLGDTVRLIKTTK